MLKRINKEKGYFTNIYRDSDDRLEYNVPLLPKVSKFKKELHGYIFHNNIKAVKNLLKTCDSNWLKTKDGRDYTSIDFCKRYGTNEMLKILFEKLIKDNGGILECHSYVNSLK